MVVPEFPKLSESFIASKFAGLLSHGWDVHVVCQRSTRDEWLHFAFLSCSALRQRVHVAWPQRPRWLSAMLLPILLIRCCLISPFATLRYFRRGYPIWGVRVLRTFFADAPLILLDPDIVHFEFGALAVGRTPLLRTLGVKTVVSFRGYDLNYVGLDDPLYYFDVWLNVDAVHVLGTHLWQQAQLRGCPSDRLHAMIPPAIDLKRFDGRGSLHAERVGSMERPLRILSVGRLDWTKGYEYAIQAVRVLVDRGIHVRYEIIGGGKYLEALSFARHQMPINDYVEFLGAGPSDLIIDRMRWADIFLHAAVSEGFCNAVIEAQAMNLPVVCSDAGGLTENVIDGETGFVAPRRDAQTLADRLVTLARAPDLRQSLGKAGRRRVIENFELSHQIAQFDELYQQILGPPQNPDVLPS